MRTFLLLKVACSTLSLLGATACTAEKTPRNQTCAATPGSIDQAGALQSCLDQAEDGATVRLRPGKYLLAGPLTVRHSITLTTIDNGADCATGALAGCATLVIGQVASRTQHSHMPIEVVAPNVTFLNLRVEGVRGEDLAYDRRVCLDDATRPTGGGIRVSAPHFTLQRSIITRVSCYTAMEVTKGSDSLTVKSSKFLANGDHRPGTLWSDGLTVHDVANAKIVDNEFIDNTDVQLIFGGCQRCTIRGNRLRHSGLLSGSSFADLMLHSWPTTSGVYDGSKISNNYIDCGIQRRCGYGIMIGSNPWYPGKASGGEVSGNVVRYAMRGIDIDALTGPMTITGNSILYSGGRFPSACGPELWSATNISSSSLPLVRGDVKAKYSTHISAARCLLARTAD